MSKDCCKPESGKHECRKHDCGNHGSGRNWRKIIIQAVLVVVGLLVLTTLVFVIVLTTHRPTPSITLQDATLFAFNVSSPPNTLTINMQVTLSAHNPYRVGICYDSLDIYASYRNQEITLRAHTGNFFQGQKDTNVWSPFLYGNAIPVAPYYIAPLCQDQAAGMVQLVITVNGQLRWKLGSFPSRAYHVHITCDAIASFGGDPAACPPTTCGRVVIADGLKYQLDHRCTVRVD